MIAIAIYVRLVPGQAPEPMSLARASCGGAIGVLPVLGIFLIVFGGIYGGVFTPTEGAAVGAAATFLVGAGPARTRPGEKFGCSFYATAETIGDDLHDLPRRRHAQLRAGADAGADPAGRRGRRPRACRRWRSSAAILVFYVLLGCVMDELSMILLTIPIFFPLVMALRLGPEARREGDLVRHPGADGGGDRPDRAAGGPERLCGQRHGQGRRSRELPRRDALPGSATSCAPCCCCCSRR